MEIASVWMFVGKDRMGRNRELMRNKARFLALFYNLEFPLPSNHSPYKIKTHGHKETKSDF